RTAAVRLKADTTYGSNFRSPLSAALRRTVMRDRFRLIRLTIACVALCFSSAVPLFADDGPSLYTQLCASCHDAGTERAPNRETLRAMTPERVLSALESGP